MSKLRYNNQYVVSADQLKAILCYCDWNLLINLSSMPQRKVWTQEEDRVLKFLREVRGVAKWSVISQTMEKQFNIVGRNGKQCRERYHNHLDKSIINSQWTIQQENKLFEIQDELGNKWALISSKLPGRTDNCVKNHFYSKLRKGLRKLNKKIHKHFKREYKEIKTATLYKIIQTIENKGKVSTNGQIDTYQICKKIKNWIKEFQGQVQKIQNQNQELEYIKIILEDISLFQPQIKKITKRNGLKSSKKLEDEDSSQKPLSNKVSSTKSIYDEEQSQFSNSQIYSSSSFGQQSFPSNRSQGLLKPFTVMHRSHSIDSQSQSEDQQNHSHENILYKSAKSLQSIKNIFKSNSQVKLFGSLKLSQKKIIQISQPVKQMNQNKSMSSQKSDKSAQVQKIFQCHADHINMIGEEQNFPIYMKLRLFSPKKPSHDDIMQMNDERDELLYGQKMEIECQNLVHNFSGLGLNDMPKLGHILDI